jgi:hypothetical protein
MRPVTVTRTGVGVSAVVPVDYLQSAFAIGFGAVVTGGATYTIQHTFDNVLDSTVTPTWFNHEDLIDETTNQDGNYAFPIRGIRINQTVGTGSVALTVLQGNPR